jgi:hypothetical protein
MDNWDLNQLVKRCIAWHRDSRGVKFEMLDIYWCESMYRMSKLKTKEDQVTLYFNLLNKLPIYDGTWTHLVIPILCEYREDHLDNEHFKYQTNYDDPSEMRHYILCIVDMQTHTLEMYDPLKNVRLMHWWGNQLAGMIRLGYTWEFSNVKSFTNVKCIHQSHSLNCGLFVILYVHMRAIGASHQEIDNDQSCNEDLATQFSTIISEHNKKINKL